MSSVTKAMPIQFIDDKCHIKKWKGCKTALSGYYACLSHDLLLMPSEADTYTFATERFQETRWWPTYIWFKRVFSEVHLEIPKAIGKGFQ